MDVINNLGDLLSGKTSAKVDVTGSIDNHSLIMFGAVTFLAILGAGIIIVILLKKL